jgi:hypothetical protein
MFNANMGTTRHYPPFQSKESNYEEELPNEKKISLTTAALLTGVAFAVAQCTGNPNLQGTAPTDGKHGQAQQPAFEDIEKVETPEVRRPV